MTLELNKLSSSENFQGSNEFLQRFKKHHSIVCKSIQGESGLVEESAIESFNEVY